MTLKLVSGGAPSAGADAALWATRLDRGDLDAAEYAAFEAWLDQPGNPEAYAAAAAALHIFDGLDTELPELAALRAEALRDVAAQGELAREGRFFGRHWMPWAGGAIAASILAALLLLGGPVAIDGRPASAPRFAGNENAVEAPAQVGKIFRTAVGEQRTVALADGSSVTLNTASEIAVDYRPGERTVRLVRGQAIFDVAHAPDRPFAVVAGGRRVTALGTVFEVRLDKERFNVTLLRGKVRIDEERPDRVGVKPAALAVLAPGQSFLSVGALAPVVASVDVEKQTLWRRSLVEFDDETIAGAVTELNRYSSTPMVIADSKVAAMRMSGIVKTGDPAEFTALVGAMLPVASRKNAQGEIELYLAQ